MIHYKLNFRLLYTMLLFGITYLFAKDTHEKMLFPPLDRVVKLSDLKSMYTRIEHMCLQTCMIDSFDNKVMYDVHDHRAILCCCLNNCMARKKKCDYLDDSITRLQGIIDHRNRITAVIPRIIFEYTFLNHNNNWVEMLPFDKLCSQFQKYTPQVVTITSGQEFDKEAFDSLYDVTKQHVMKTSSQDSIQNEYRCIFDTLKRNIFNTDDLLFLQEIGYRDKEGKLNPIAHALIEHGLYYRRKKVKGMQSDLLNEGEYYVASYNRPGILTLRTYDDLVIKPTQ